MARCFLFQMEHLLRWHCSLPLPMVPQQKKLFMLSMGPIPLLISGEQRFAQLLFMDGKLTQVYGYQGTDDAGAPAEITPSDGDTFTILQKWMDLDTSGNVTQVVEVPGDTFTFGRDSVFTWSAVYAPAGDYLVGFMVSDLDGNTSQTFTQITMQLSD